MNKKLIIWFVMAVLVVATASASQAWWNTSFNHRKPIEINSSIVYNQVFLTINLTNLTLYTGNCSKELRIINDSGIEIDSQIINNLGQGLANGSQWCVIGFVASKNATSNISYHAYYSNAGATKPDYDTLYFEDYFSVNIASPSTDTDFLTRWTQKIDNGAESVSSGFFNVNGASGVWNDWISNNQTGIKSPMYAEVRFALTQTYHSAPVGIVQDVVKTANGTCYSSTYGNTINGFTINQNNGACMLDNTRQVIKNASFVLPQNSNLMSMRIEVNNTRALMTNLGNMTGVTNQFNYADNGVYFNFSIPFNCYVTGFNNDNSKKYDYCIMKKGNYYSTSPTLTLQSEESSALIIFVNSPADDIISYEQLSVNFTYTASDSLSGNCTLYLNNSINASMYNIPSGSVSIINATGMIDGVYIWKVGCVSSLVSPANSSDYTYIFDSTQPIITNNNLLFLNGSQWWYNITLNFSIEDDNNYEAIFNVTRLADNMTIASAYYNTAGYSVYNITATLNNQTLTGWYKFLLEAYDGHTAKKISDLSVDSKNKELKFSDSKSQVSIAPVDKNLFSTATTTKKADRYTFEFTKDASKTNTKGYSDFIVEGGDSIEILSDSKYKGHMIIKKGGNPNDWFWVDFETAQGCPVVVTRQNKNKVIARVYCGDADYKLNSIGRLNVNNLTIYYYFDASNIALAETYALQIVQGFPAYYYMQATYNPLKYNATLRVPSAVLSWNNTLYNATLVNSSSSMAYFNFTTTPSGLTSFKTQIPHFWNFTIANQSNVSFYSATNLTNQSLYNIIIAQCNASINNTIVNFTYFDEVTSTAIDAQNTYVATFYDGTYNYNLTGVFATGANHAFCTNLPASELEYSWLMYGTFTIENDTYLDRIYTFNLANGFTIGNYYNTTIPLSLIGANDSSTITYSWQTTSYQAITGMLEIYKCNANGSRQLVESTSIISGVAVANLVLLYQQYAYEVIIDGERYTGDYTTCHLESVTNPQYYVDIYGGDITTAIGLLLIDCKITQSGNNVTMLFSDIGGDSDLEGCLQVSRQDIYGVTNVTRECSNLVGEGTGQVTYSFPSDSNTYYAQGYIYQGDSTGYCTGLATYPIYQSNTEQTFGVSAIFAVFMIVLSMILIFSDNGEKMLGAGMFGFVVAFFLGVLTIPWALMSLLIAFCLTIALIGRYARKGAS